MGKIWAFPQELWFKFRSGGDFLPSSVAGAISSFVPTDLLIFEMDPKLLASGEHVIVFKELHFFKFRMNKQREKPEKLAEVLKVGLPPPQLRPASVQTQQS